MSRNLCLRSALSRVSSVKLGFLPQRGHKLSVQTQHGFMVAPELGQSLFLFFRGLRRQEPLPRHLRRFRCRGDPKPAHGQGRGFQRVHGVGVSVPILRGEKFPKLCALFFIEASKGPR